MSAYLSKLAQKDTKTQNHHSKGELMNLQQEIDKLNCNAFIGVCYPVDKHSELAWHIEDDEERLCPINELIDDLKELEDSDDLVTLRSLAKRGITEVVLIRGW